jgi:hypothetical protein
MRVIEVPAVSGIPERPEADRRARRASAQWSH